MFAAILYVSNPELFRRAICPADPLSAGPSTGSWPPWPSCGSSKHRPSPVGSMLQLAMAQDVPQRHLEPRQIDDLYSELVCVPW